MIHYYRTPEELRKRANEIERLNQFWSEGLAALTDGLVSNRYFRDTVTEFGSKLIEVSEGMPVPTEESIDQMILVIARISIHYMQLAEASAKVQWNWHHCVHQVAKFIGNTEAENSFTKRSIIQRPECMEDAIRQKTDDTMEVLEAIAITLDRRKEKPGHANQ